MNKSGKYSRVTDYREGQVDDGVQKEELVEWEIEVFGRFCCILPTAQLYRLNEA